MVVNQWLMVDENSLSFVFRDGSWSANRSSMVNHRLMVVNQWLANGQLVAE